jgi:hypothetical protein
MSNTKTLVIIGGALAFQQFCGGGFGGLQQFVAQGQANRTQRDQQSQQTTKLQLAQDATKERDKIAKQRYETGCVMVVGNRDRSKFANLVEGQPVLGNADNNPLGVGTIVCDATGLTAEIIPNDKGLPVVGLTAFTADRSVIAAAAKRYPGATFTTSTQQ